MDIVEEFVTATKALPTPEIFRRWAALALISSLLSRRCWTTVAAGKKLHANLFVLLVGRPASGKSLAIREVQALLRPYGTSVALAPAEVTPERLVQKLGEVFLPGRASEEGHWSLAALPSEMGAFMPKPDIAFMQRIADLWDCPDQWSKETKHGKELGHQDDIAFPYMTLLGGAQPAWINALISQDMLGLGLPSRVLFVLSTVPGKVVLFGEANTDAMLAKLAPKLELLQNVKGFVPFTQDAQTLFHEWFDAGAPGADGIPLPNDPVIAPYIDRRFLHVGKLALCISMGRHPERQVIDAPDLRTAMDLLFEAERGLPEVLASAGGNPYRQRQMEILKTVRVEYDRTKRAVPEKYVRELLGRVIPSFHVALVMEEMVANGALIDTSGGVASAPNRLFRPSK